MSSPQIPANTGAEQEASHAEGNASAEMRERQAAVARGASTPPKDRCAPEIEGLSADLIYTLVAENLRDYALFLMDRDGVIQCWGESARLMKWWTKEQAEGAHLRLVYPDGGSEDGTAEDHLRRAADTGEYTGEGHRVRSDGSTFWAYITLTALRNPKGELVGFTKVTRDFSARRAVEAALQGDQRVPSDVHTTAEEMSRLRRAVATISHELRTPLNAIAGSISLLELQLASGDRDPVHIQRLQRNSRHLLTIVEDVLELSRAEGGYVTLTPNVHRLGAAIEEALADVETQAQGRNVTLVNSVSGAAGDLPYWGDEARVSQILVNLLTNAIKFTDAGGRITISGGTGETVTGASLAGPGPWAYVRVEDTGRGIPAENLGSIFEPFEQSEVGDQQRGTGLGLSISRHLARQMDGDLTARSELGVGSRFTLWLPITKSGPVPR